MKQITILSFFIITLSFFTDACSLRFLPATKMDSRKSLYITGEIVDIICDSCVTKESSNEIFKTDYDNCPACEWRILPQKNGYLPEGVKEIRLKHYSITSLCQTVPERNINKNEYIGKYVSLLGEFELFDSIAEMKFNVFNSNTNYFNLIEFDKETQRYYFKYYKSEKYHAETKNLDIFDRNIDFQKAKGYNDIFYLIKDLIRLDRVTKKENKIKIAKNLMYHSLYQRYPQFFNKMVVNNFKLDTDRQNLINERNKKLTITDTIQLKLVINKVDYNSDTIDIKVLIDDKIVFEKEITNLSLPEQEMTIKYLSYGKHRVTVQSSVKNEKITKPFDLYFNTEIRVNYKNKKDSAGKFLPGTEYFDITVEDYL